MKAVKFIGAEKYLWESNQNQTIENKISIPKAQQVIIKTDDDSKNYRLAYKFDIYAVKPLNRSFVYVDAETGLILKSVNRICYVGRRYIYS